ncbi:MAG: hypothetical protein IIB31_06900 [Chloroflexi bacterium]|nr:hypothetical protein [Chloroflexota bacterium]MCH8898627.1 hypothetical protein [Chloroflexota bacterium]
MRENRVKKVMSQGKLALGTYVTFADPQVVEIIGLAGFDAAFIDMEHTTFDLNLITEMIRAADLVGVTSIVRVPDNDEKLILRLLDAGAEGIIIPHVDGLEGAKRAVEAVRYAPLGHRGGAAGTRAARFGSIGWDDHIQQSNQQVLLSVMTEDERGINDIEQIAALEGIDLVSIGPTDFSEYMGIRDPGSQVLRDEIKKLADKIKGIGKAKMQIPMNHAALPLGPRELLDLGVGYTHVAPPPTAVLMRSLRDRLQSIRQEIG